MKALITLVLAGVLLGSVGFPNRAGAGDRNEWKHRRGDDRRSHDRHRDRGDARFGRRDRYFVEREVHVIREYYRPYHRPLPRGIRHKYYRTGYLPRGWAKRMRPVPWHIERNLVVLRHGHHRGIIDGHAVVYNSRGLIVDIAVLF